MKDKDKNQEQLIKELDQLRRRIAELETSGRNRNRFEEALRTERDKAQHYLDIAEVILVVLNKRGEITLINRKGNQILGYKDGELLGKNWFATCLPPPVRKDVKAVFLKLMAGETKVTEFYENAALTKAGTERIIGWHNTLLKDAQGYPIGTLSSGMDITERKQTEEALRDSETRFRTLFKAIPDTVLVHDDEGNILHINEIGAQQLEWSAKDLIGRNLREIVTPENRASIADHVRETHKVGWSRFETTYVSRSGWRIMAEVNERPIKFGNKKAILSVARDITERKEAEKTLAREKSFSNAIINSSPGLLFVFDEKGNIIRWNSNAEKITGYSAGEISKMNILDFVAKEDTKTAAEAAQEALTKGQASVEIKILSKPGKKIPFYITGRRTKIENAICVVCSGMDITERKQAEEELKATQIRFAIAAQSASDLIWEWDIPIGRLEWFGPIDKFLGYAPGKFPRTIEAWEKTIHPDDHDRVMTALDRHLKDQTPYDEEYRVRRKDGTYRSWIDRGTAQRDMEGNLLKMVGACTDITERKQAEEALRESEEKYRNLVERANEGIGIAQDVILCYVNPRLAQMIGYAVEELIGAPFSNFFIAEEVPKIVDRYRRRMAGKKVTPIYESALRHKNGSRIEVELNAGIIPYKGKPADLVLVRDITERKQAEEALRKSEGKYRTILENIEEGYYEVDLAGNFTFFNDAMCRIWGYPREELMGMNNRQYTDKENAKRLFQAFSEVYRTGEIGKGYDYEIIKKDGTRGYVEASISSRKDSSGKAIGFRGIIRDITERKQAENALRESEERFRLAFENANTGVCLVDLEGNLTRVNSKMCEIFGYTKKELEHMTVNDIAHPEDIDKSPEFIQKTLQGEIDRGTFEKRYFHKKGHVVTCAVSSALVRDAEDVPLYLISHVHDITEQKKLQEILDKEREELKLIIDASPIIVFYKDTEGRFIRVNKLFAEALNMPKENFAGKTVFDLYSPQIAQGMTDDDQEVFQSRRPKLNIIEQYESASGIRWVQTDKIPIFDKDGVPIGLIGFAQDITDRKLAEEEIKRGYEQLEETLHATVSALASTVEMKDQYTAGHQPRVTQLACAIAEEMGFSAEQIEGIRMAASIHDIGKIMVPAEILNKPGPLTEIQFEMVKMHPRAGYDILKGLKLPWPVAQIILQHHELMDGSGYPQKLSGEKIMTEARILTVANVVEAMNSHRPYRPAFDIKEALAEISKNRGILYDSAAVDACLRLFAEKRFAFG